ncbi:uncharacterized protein L3040_001395 [Drepanopeziza brunnea f. sp. 'multigermtubi']|uniref:uncharacterized protein n=1 Tax=Drepanopeziza brunnea f. sp. 'multigermtubi' TaxID=698441 RepID=UPI002383B032|nr:hypothetical protein L3040_001395 [Drepanopeziza brunnea f. sp. 'multigermtubi']
MHEVRVVSGKGLGVFATKFIPRGTRIFSERPLLSITHQEDSSHIYSAAKRLATKDRAELMRLSFHTNKELEATRRSAALLFTVKSTIATALHAFSRGAKATTVPPNEGLDSIADHVAVLNIFRSNAFRLGLGQGQTAEGISHAVFAGISRINHSCVPNAQANWHGILERFNVHATRDIEVAEEVSLAYLPENGDLRETRMKRLSDGYGFECGCPACDLSKARGRKGEERRVAVKKLIETYALNMMRPGAVKAQDGELKTIMAWIEMYESEGIAGRELASLYDAAVSILMDQCKHKEALVLAGLSLQLSEDCVGKDHPEVLKSRQTIAQLRYFL